MEKIVMPKRFDQMTTNEIAEWVKDLCLMFGTEVHTAYTVAGIFVKGLECPIAMGRKD